MTFEEAKVTTRDSLVAFILDMRKDLRAHPERWENADLDSYLEALAAWIDAAPGWYKGQKKAMPDQPDWNFMASALAAASIYE